MMNAKNNLENLITMDIKLLLVKSITLLYRESALSDKVTNSSDLVGTLLNYIKISDVSLGVYSERDLLLNLKNTVLGMTKNPFDYVYDQEVLLQQLRVNCMHDDKVYDIISKAIIETKDMSESSIKRSVTNLTKDLNNFFIEEQISDVLTKASLTFKNNRDKIKNRQ